MSSIDTTLFVPGVARRLGHDVTAAASEAQDVRIAASRPSKVLRQQGHDRRLCPDANGVQGIDIIVESRLDPSCPSSHLLSFRGKNRLRNTQAIFKAG
jgi:hypothetical protein